MLNFKHFKPKLKQSLEMLDLSLSTAQIDKLLAYLSLLYKWNKVYNLSSVRLPEDMLVRHLLDSLSIVPFIRGTSILDIGTGGGLPGMVLAIIRPDWHLTLLDSNGKKTRFLIQAQTELALDNVSIVCSRIETWQNTACFQTILSRAYSELALFHQHAAPFCCDTGQLLAMKGKLHDTEIQSLKIASEKLTIHRLNVPFLAAERHLIEITL